MTDVTVTTVLYNSADALPAYAEAITPALKDGVVRIVAVDNASPDRSSELFRSLLPDAQLIVSPENVGFAGGCNRAWPDVDTRYWLLLNPDVEARSEGIERLVRWMDVHPKVGIASPLLRSGEGTPLTVARSEDALWRPVAETLRLHKFAPPALRSRWLLSGRAATPEIIDGWVPGAALIARTAAVRDVGPLNEDLFMYGEDREWCWRMRRAGWDVGVCQDVEFVHDGGSSARQTWAPEEQVRREVAGHVRAATQMRGRRWARLYALLTGAALRLAALDRRRDSVVRADCELRGRLYLQAGKE